MREENEVLGSCGCVDYHMADCPLRTNLSNLELTYEGDDEYDWYTRSLNGDY